MQRWSGSIVDSVRESMTGLVSDSINYSLIDLISDSVRDWMTWSVTDDFSTDEWLCQGLRIGFTLQILKNLFLIVNEGVAHAKKNPKKKPFFKKIKPSNDSVTQSFEDHDGVTRFFFDTLLA